MQNARHRNTAERSALRRSADGVRRAGGPRLMRPVLGLAAAVLAAVLLAACATGAGGAAEPPGPQYEIWALDQGTNLIHIIVPDDAAEDGFSVAERVDLGAWGGGEIDMPHMIDFTSDFRYAFVANPAGANTAVIRVADREVVAVLDTGPGSHMAAVTPGDRQVLVDVIGAGAIVEITLDLENERFEIGRTLTVREDPLVQERADAFPSDEDGRIIAQPVCHDYTADGRYAYVTLGPALDHGGLVVLDTESLVLEKVFPVGEIRVNCGTVLGPDGVSMYLNGGSLSEGHWYVFDTRTHEPIADAGGALRRTSRGEDAHGLWKTPDGSELWMVNRASSNGIVIDPRTHRVIDDIAWTGESPDILTFSPDGRFAFVTLRGPNPRSGPHQIAGGTPGVAVIEVARREKHALLQPDAGNELSDFHGIGLVPLSGK